MIGGKNFGKIKDEIIPYLEAQTRGNLQGHSNTGSIIKDAALVKTSEELPFNVFKGFVSAAMSDFRAMVLGAVSGAAVSINAFRQMSSIKSLSKLNIDQKMMDRLIDQGRNPKASKSLFRDPQKTLKNLVKKGKDNPAVVYQTLKGAAKLENYNLEKNKDNPKGKGLQKLLDSETSQKIMRASRRNIFE